MTLQASQHSPQRFYLRKINLSSESIPTSTTSPDPSPSRATLPPNNLIIALAVGLSVPLGVVVIAGCSYLVWCKRRRPLDTSTSIDADPEDVQQSTPSSLSQIPELMGRGDGPEMEGKQEPQEVTGEDRATELEGECVAAELIGWVEAAELDGESLGHKSGRLIEKLKGGGAKVDL